MYAVVDIETTGGSPKTHRITEIAIYLFDGTDIVDEFVTLVNPETFIPYHITRLTGITNEMVTEAPRFYEIAKRVVEITSDALFVAHNVNFDYHFVQNEFDRLGYPFMRETLCAVRLSRKCIPGLKSYSLGNLCQSLGIEINNRHRAAGDAYATVSVLKMLLGLKPELFANGLDIPTGIMHYAPNFNYQKLRDIPECVGVYYLYNSRGELIFIGRSDNIKKSIKEQFELPRTKKSERMLAQTVDIDYMLTGSELIAQIIEAEGIVENNPEFNTGKRVRQREVGLYAVIDGHGYLNFTIDTLSVKGKVPRVSFESKEKAKSVVNWLINNFGLCQTLCGQYGGSGPCFHRQIGLCMGACTQDESPGQYNLRANAALQSLSIEGKSFLLIDKGRNYGEQSFLKVINGRIAGYGFFNPEYVGNSIDLLIETATPCGHHNDVVNAIADRLANPTAYRIINL